MKVSNRNQAKVWTRLRGMAAAIAILVLLSYPTSRAAAPTATPPIAVPSVAATAAPVPASWLVRSTFGASSLETGRIGYLEAWSPAGGPYAFRYSLLGQPADVAVDSQTGLLAISRPLKPATYSFQVVVANRNDASVVARFPASLIVTQAVTADRKAGQILHKNYFVDSGEYGRPNGTDYTAVLVNIRKAIISDQQAVGDGYLRAAIYFRRGQQYDYTVNDWPAGIQYLTVAADPTYNVTGARPKLRNIRKTYNFDSELAIIGTGTGSAFDLVPDNVKSYAPLIQTVEAGQDTVTLRTVADAAKITVGRWYMIGSYDQQVDGFPPNIRYYDYVRVSSISGAVIKLDRKLQHRHRGDGFEVPSNPSSLGLARIIPLDLGGTHGFPATRRLSIRQTFKDIEFVKNPNTTNGSNTVLYIGTAIDAAFYNCISPRPVPSIVQHMYFSGGTITTSEPDKLITALILDGVTSGELGGGTGVEFILLRGGVTAPIYLSPRHLRLVDMTIDATKDTFLWYPVTFAYNGPVLSAEFESTIFKVNSTNTDRRIMPTIQSARTSVGKDSSWSGATLLIPTRSPNFLDWEVWAYEGAAIVASNGAKGVIQSLTGTAGGAAIQVGITWTSGTKPLSGTISFTRGRFLKIDSNSRLYGRSLWTDDCGGFEVQELPATFTTSNP